MSDPKYRAYNRSEKGRARYQRYNRSVKGAAADERYRASGRKAFADTASKQLGLSVRLVDELGLTPTKERSCADR